MKRRARNATLPRTSLSAGRASPPVSATHCSIGNVAARACPAGAGVLRRLVRERECACLAALRWLECTADPLPQAPAAIVNVGGLPECQRSAPELRVRPAGVSGFAGARRRPAASAEVRAPRVPGPTEAAMAPPPERAPDPVDGRPGLLVDALAGHREHPPAVVEVVPPLDVALPLPLELDVWREAAPGGAAVSVEQTVIERSTTPELHDRALVGITRPTLTVYKPDKPDGSAVLILPGGAYLRVAIDKEGEEIAKEIFKANEEVPGKRIYKTVNKLNFIGERICPPPQLQIPISDWKKVHGLHVQLSIRYDRKSGEPYSLYISKHAPLTSWEKTAVDWCEALYMSLIPWQDTIKNIQSDFS